MFTRNTVTCVIVSSRADPNEVQFEGYAYVFQSLSR